MAPPSRPDPRPTVALVATLLLLGVPSLFLTARLSPPASTAEQTPVPSSYPQSALPGYEVFEDQPGLGTGRVGMRIAILSPDADQAGVRDLLRALLGEQMGFVYVYQDAAGMKRDEWMARIVRTAAGEGAVVDFTGWPEGRS